MNMRDRVIAAFGDEIEMPRNELALKVWPVEKYPRAWGYASHGGPPNWVRTWGAAVKRNDFSERWDDHRRRWLVRRPPILSTKGDL
jgi:hypothetical protein